MILYSFPIHLSSFGVGVIAAIADAINTIALIINAIIINIILFLWFKDSLLDQSFSVF